MSVGQYETHTADGEGGVNNGEEEDQAHGAGAPAHVRYFEGLPETFPLASALGELWPRLEGLWWSVLLQLIEEGQSAQQFDTLLSVVVLQTAKRQSDGLSGGPCVLPACGKFVNEGIVVLLALVKDIVCLSRHR